MAQKQKKTQKMSPKQRQARLDAAQARERAAQEAKERKEFWKRVGIAIVAILLIIGLMLPMTALSFCGSQQVAQQAATSETASTAASEATSAAASTSSAASESASATSSSQATDATSSSAQASSSSATSSSQAE